MSESLLSAGSEVAESQESPEVDQGQVVGDDGNQVTLEDVVPTETQEIQENPDVIVDHLERPEKFKTEEDLIKAYTHLEKKLSEQATTIKDITGKVPDSYEIPDKEDFIFDSEDTLLGEFKQVAKEYNLPQEAFSKVMELYEKDINRRNPDYDSEIKKLGDNYQEKLFTLNQWVNNNFTEDQVSMINSFASSSDAIKLLDVMRSKMVSNANHLPDAAATRPVVNEKSIIDSFMNDYDAIKDNPDAQAELMKKLASAV